MGLSKATIQAAEEFYAANYKGHKIAPRRVAALKEAIAKGLHSGMTALKAAKAWFKENDFPYPVQKTEEEPKQTSLDLEPKKKEVKEEPKKEEKPKKKEEDPFETSKIGVDRATLVSALGELGVKTYPTDATDRDLRVLLHDKIRVVVQDPAKPPILTEFVGNESKLFDVIQDCFGLYVDVRAADCVACPDLAACARTYFENIRDGYETVLTKAGLEDTIIKAVAKAVAKTEKTKPVQAASSATTSVEKPDNRAWDEKLPKHGGPVVGAVEAFKPWRVVKLKEGFVELPVGKDTQGNTHPLPGYASKKHLEALGYGPSNVELLEPLDGKPGRGLEDWLVVFAGDNPVPEKFAKLHAMTTQLQERKSCKLSVVVDIWRKLDFHERFYDVLDDLLEAGVACPAKELPKDVVADLSPKQKLKFGLA